MKNITNPGYEIISNEVLLTEIKIDEKRFNIYMVELGNGKFEYRVVSNEVQEIVVHESSNFAANLNESDPNLEHQQYEILTQAVSNLIDLLVTLYPEQKGLKTKLKALLKSGMNQAVFEYILKKLPITRTGSAIVGLPLSGKSTLQSFMASKVDEIVTQANEISLLYPPSWQFRKITIWFSEQLNKFIGFNRKPYINYLKDTELNKLNLNSKEIDYFYSRPHFTNEEINEAILLKTQLNKEKDKVFVEDSERKAQLDKSMRASDVALKDFQMQLLRIKYNIEFFKLAVQSSFEPLVMGYFMQALAILCGQLKIDISIPKSGRVEREIKNLLMLFQFLPYQPERYIYVDIDLETQTVRLKKENYIEQQRRAITFPQSTYYKSFYDYVRKNGSFEMISIESADDSLIKDLVIEQNAQHPITFKNLVKFLEGLIDFYEEEWIYYLTMLSPNLLLRIFRNSKIREIVEEDLALQEQVYFTFFGVYDLNQIYALLKESETKLAIGDSQCLDKIKNLFKDRGADFLRYLIHRKKFIFELECLIRFRKEIENAYSKEQ